MQKCILLLALLVPIVSGAEVWQARYGVAETFNFKLYNADGTVDVDEVDGGTEVSLSCNEGAETTATNDFVDEGTFYSIALTAAEMQCERIAVVIAATTTEVFFIQTHSNASAMTPQADANVTQFGGSAGTFASGRPEVNISHFGGTAGTFSSGRPEVNVSHWLGTAAATPTTAGVPEVDVTFWLGGAVATPSATGVPEVDVTHWHSSDLLTGTGPLAGLGVLDRGTAQSDSTTSLQIRAAAAFADDELNGATGLIYSATTGAGQRSAISDYVGSTDTATLGTTLPTDPTGTVRYEIYGTASASGTLAANVTQVEGTDATDYLATLDDATLARLPAALVGGRIDASVGAMANDVMTAAAAASDFGTELGTANWVSTTRLLTAGTNIVLAKGTGITGFNDLSAAQVNTEVDTAIADARLDELVAADSDIDGLAPPTVGSVFHELLTSSAASFTFDQTTDSLEAIRDNLAGGAADWTADERTAMRAILGIPATGTTPEDPTTGILDTIRDDTVDIQSRLPAALVSGRMDSSTGAMAANVMTAAAAAADLTTELQTGLATSSAVTALDTKLGTPAGASVSADVAAVKSDSAAILVDTAEIGVAGAGLTAADDAVLAAIAALNNLSANQVRDLVIEDQGGGVSLGCALAVLLAYASGDIVTSGTTTTYEEPSGTETRTTGTVTSAGNRTATITCPTY